MRQSRVMIRTLPVDTTRSMRSVLESVYTSIRSAYWTELFCLATTLPLKIGEPFLLHALEAVGVDDHRPVLAFGSRGRGRRGQRRARSRGARLGGCPAAGPRLRRPRTRATDHEDRTVPRATAQADREPHSLGRTSRACPSGRAAGAAVALVPPKVALTRPWTRVISSEGRTSSPVPADHPSALIDGHRLVRPRPSLGVVPMQHRRLHSKPLARHQHDLAAQLDVPWCPG